MDIKSEKKEVRVVERWADWETGNWIEGTERKGSEKLRMGGEGRLEVSASVGKDGSGRLFWRREKEAGMEGNGHIQVRVRVKNGTKKSVSAHVKYVDDFVLIPNLYSKVSGLKLSLCRRLRILDGKGGKLKSSAPVITANVVQDHFRGVGYEFPSGEEREVMIYSEVAMDESWSVRRGTLFELDLLLRVEVECGFLAYATIPCFCKS